MLQYIIYRTLYYRLPLSSSSLRLLTERLLGGAGAVGTAATASITGGHLPGSLSDAVRTIGAIVFFFIACSISFNLASAYFRPSSIILTGVTTGVVAVVDVVALVVVEAAGVEEGTVVGLSEIIVILGAFCSILIVDPSDPLPPLNKLKNFLNKLIKNVLISVKTFFAYVIPVDIGLASRAVSICIKIHVE